MEQLPALAPVIAEYLGTGRVLGSLSKRFKEEMEARSKAFLYSLAKKYKGVITTGGILRMAIANRDYQSIHQLANLYFGKLSINWDLLSYLDIDKEIARLIISRLSYSRKVLVGLWFDIPYERSTEANEKAASINKKLYEWNIHNNEIKQLSRKIYALIFDNRYDVLALLDTKVYQYLTRTEDWNSIYFSQSPYFYKWLYSYKLYVETDIIDIFMSNTSNRYPLFMKNYAINERYEAYRDTRMALSLGFPFPPQHLPDSMSDQLIYARGHVLSILARREDIDKFISMSSDEPDNIRLLDYIIRLNVDKDIVYKAIAKALSRGWYEIVDGQINKKNMINVMAYLPSVLLNSRSVTFFKTVSKRLKLPNYEWFEYYLSDKKRKGLITEIEEKYISSSNWLYFWQNLLISAIKADNKQLVKSIIFKHIDDIDDEFKRHILILSNSNPYMEKSITQSIFNASASKLE